MVTGFSAIANLQSAYSTAGTPLWAILIGTECRSSAKDLQSPLRCASKYTESDALWSSRPPVDSLPSPLSANCSRCPLRLLNCPESGLTGKSLNFRTHP
jgi:hypothetical protein